MASFPYIITLNKIGKSDLGYISFVQGQSKQIPFTIKRVFWTYYTPESVIRGGHAHRSTLQAIIAVSGKIVFEIKDQHNYHEVFTLESPNQLLIIPTLFWSDIKFSHNAVLLCLASEEYNEKEYIRDFTEFKLMKK
jgi:dTDP-4-dehydrorhamnose 3,5-epimerase-like enzyme